MRSLSKFVIALGFWAGTGIVPGRGAEPPARPPEGSPGEPGTGPSRRAPEARLVRLEGAVSVQRTGTSWTRARPGEPLYPGDQVKAGRASRATLRYWDGIDVVLEPSTLVEVLDRAAPEDEALALWLGEVMVEVRRGAAARTRPATAPAPAFRIRTPSAVAGAEGTRFRVRVGAQGKADVAVLEGKVRVGGLEGDGGDVTLAPGQQTAVQRGGSPGRVRPAALPWASAAAGLARRERLDEPFFGELERLRSLRFLALVDLRRDALANPARVARLTRGEGYDLVELARTPSQGAAERYRERDLAGAVHTGLADRIESGRSADVFHYRTLDDGRWAGALRLSWAELETRESLAGDGAPSPFPGFGAHRGADLEGPDVAAQVQRAWAYGRTSIGVGLLAERGRARADETFWGGPGFPAGSELLASRLDESAGALALGFSRDFGPGHDRGLVLRYQEREADQTDGFHRTDGAGAPLLDRTRLDSAVLGVDFLERRMRRGESLVAVRAFAEEARRDRRAGFTFDPSQLRRDQLSEEVARVYGLGIGWGRRARPGCQVFADLGWQRLDLAAGVFDPTLGAVYAEDRVETRTSLHLGWLLEGERFDLRTSYELAHRHGRRDFTPVAGAVEPFDAREPRWLDELSITVGRQLARERRVELEFVEREPVAPERVVRLRLLRSF